MSLRTIGSLVGAANGAKDLHSMAANFLGNFRRHANGVNGVTITSEPFVVAVVGVAGTSDSPRLTFALIWTERSSWQVTDYLSPDDDAFIEGWGADNSCGFHIESSESQKEQRVEVLAAHLLMTNDKQVEMLKNWKASHDAKIKEHRRLEHIKCLENQIGALREQGNAQRAQQREGQPAQDQPQKDSNQ